MAESPKTVCIACGLEVSDPPQLHRLPSGQPCTACRDRVLAGLPPALPSRRVPAGRLDVEEPQHVDRALEDAGLYDDPHADRRF